MTQFSEDDRIIIVLNEDEQNTKECSDVIQSNTELETNRIAKRTRENNSPESEENWITVAKKYKTVEGRSSSQEMLNKNDTQVTVIGKEALPKQFALARLFSKNNVQGFIRVKYVNPKKMIITFEKSSDADRFLQSKAFEHLEWRSHKTSEVTVSYGLIKNIELSLSEDEFSKFLSCDYDIESVRRLSKRNNENSLSAGDSNWIESETIRIAFRSASLPAYVYTNKLRVRVEPYVFPVSQCSRCWKYGHGWKTCPSKKIVCPKCSQSHENCDTTTYRCVNCTGNHMALQKVCPINNT